MPEPRLPNVTTLSYHRDVVPLPPLIVTGMSRSGTSATMRVLHSAGLDVGDELIPASEDNEVGFYEDVAFMELDQELIAAGLAAHPDVRPRWMYADLIDRSLLEPFRGRAEALVAARAERGVAWGFKDPRAAALLDFWDAAAPEARYVFVYRPPWDVADSTFRLARRPMAGRGELVVRTWSSYNRALLDFAARHPERCVLVSSAAVERAPQALVDAANGLLRDLPVQLGTAQAAAIEPGLLAVHPDGSSLAELLRAGFPDAAELYGELETRADLPSSTRPHAPERARAGAAPDVEVVADDVVAVTFGERPAEAVLVQAAALVREREGRAVAVGTGILDPEHPQILHARELLRGTFEPRALVLRHSQWEAAEDPDASVAAAGLGAWAAAIALADAGVPLMPLLAEFGAPGEVLPGARERARRHVATRHAELFARNYADVREQFDLQLADLERQRDVALAARDEARAEFEGALAKLDEVDTVKAAAEQEAVGANRRAAAAEERADAAETSAATAEKSAASAEQRAAAAEERARAAEARAADVKGALTDLRRTRAVRAAGAWWRAKQRLRRG